jgi:hypothetical protein
LIFGHRRRFVGIFLWICPLFWPLELGACPGHRGWRQQFDLGANTCLI